MTVFFEGFLGFVETFLVVVILAEINFQLEDLIKYKFEFRKGFRKKIATQILLYFKSGDKFSQRIYDALVLFPTFIAASLLPQLNGKILSEPSHSFWFFILIMLVAPLMQFFLQLGFSKAKKELMVIRLQEKTMAGFTLLLVFVLSFTMLTAADDIKDVMTLQQNHWLIFEKPLTVILFVSALIAVYYLCQQRLFSKSHHVFSELEGERKRFFLEIWKAVWLLFVCNMFLGGGPFAIAKAVLLNIICILFFEGFSRLREDQSESMVIWEMTPIMLFFVLITLVLIGFKL